MTRLSVLVGIGLMLVGAVAYALPAKQEFSALIPAFGGIVLSTGGLVGMASDSSRKHVMHLNAVVTLILLVFASLKIVPDTLKLKEASTHFVADVDVLGLSAVYLYFCIKSFLEARGLVKKTKASIITPEKVAK